MTVFLYFNILNHVFSFQTNEVGLSTKLNLIFLFEGTLMQHTARTGCHTVLMLTTGGR